MPEPLDVALAELRPLLLDETRLLRAVATGRRRGETPGWRRVEIRPVDLAAGRLLQITRFDEQQAHTSNVQGPAAAESVSATLAEPFGSWHVETLDATIQLRVTKKGEAQVHRSAPTEPADPSALRAHDRVKARLLDPAEPFLAELGLTDAGGQLKPSRAAKYRQVEEMIRALATALPGAGDPAAKPLRIVDLGCGNGYLTFAAEHFLAARGGRPVDVTGVDVKAQARDHGTDLALRLGRSATVHFAQGTAAEIELTPPPDVVLALHACDTATDEALARAVQWGAQLILAAPCCHHDLQRQLAETGHAPAPAPYGSLARHGILRERFTDVLTDALRANLLRLLGYRVDVVEFVGSRHTPRNTLIRAVRTGARPAGAQVSEYLALVAAWGISPRLAVLLAAELAAVAPDGAG